MSATALLCVLLSSTLLVGRGSGDECLTNLMTRQSISQSAAYIGELTEIGSKDQWIFPQLSITCSTTITKLRFVGEHLDRGDEVPELQIWRKHSSSISQYSKVHHTDETNIVSIERSHLYATSVSWQVHAGDVFGVYQPDMRKSRYNIAMQEGGGNISYLLENRRRVPESFDTLRSDDTGNPYPLISFEAVSRHCVSGFLDFLTIIKKANVKSGIVLNNLSAYESQVRIIPAIRFGCNGTITRALFTAETRAVTSAQTRHAELQIWYNNSSSQVYNRKRRTSLSGSTATGDLNVYEKSFTHHLRFETGDVLGLYLPEGDHSLLKIVFLSGIHSAMRVPSYSIKQHNSLAFFNANSPSVERDYDIPLLNIEIVADCGQPALPANGRVRVSSTTAGSLALYSCDEGHRLVGYRQRTCSALNGEWTYSVPSCQMVYCQAAPIPLNGQVTYNNSNQSTSFNSLVMYTCKVGFELSGTATRQCTATGQWSGTTPSCVVVDCGPPDSPTNGVVNTSNGTKLGAKAVYNCRSDEFLLEGSHLNRYCQEDGNWSGTVPECVPQEGAVTSVGKPGTTVLPLTTAQLERSESRLVTKLGISSSVGLPIHHQNSSPSLIAVVVIAVVSVVTVSMAAATVGVCARRRRQKRLQIDRRNMATAIADLQENSIDNPMYGGGQRFPVNFWETSAPSSPFADESTLYSNPAYFEYEYPEFESHQMSGHADNRPSLHYEVASMINPMDQYEIMDGQNHYEVASNLELPAFPYETPTPNSKYPPTLYGSLPQGGSYVPTEEQRSRTYENIAPSLSTPISLKSHTSMVNMFFEECDIYWKPACDSAGLYEQLARNKYREISRHQIQITENLGSGEFGQVSKGVWQSPLGEIPVAVKTLKEGKESSNDEVRFLQEAAINGQFQHHNVVKLHGVVTLAKPVMLVLELCPNGDLRNFLLQTRPLPGEKIGAKWPERLVNFCKDVAHGMEYLSRKAFVHRDLAARNILLSKCMVCKISDFGLSRDLEEESYYISHGGQIPVKWTAPEALHYKKYSTASDVWSFGCVMYEIWSLGHKPFEKYPNMEVMRMIDNGFRLAPPPGCIKPVYHLMIQCWHPMSSLRPTFTELIQSLKKLDITMVNEGHSQSTDRHLGQKSILPQSLLLGAPLDLGKNLYPELQNTYIPDQSVN